MKGPGQVCRCWNFGATGSECGGEWGRSGGDTYMQNPLGSQEQREPLRPGKRNRTEG